VGTLQLTYGASRWTWSQPFERLTIREAILKYTECRRHVDDAEWLISALRKLGLNRSQEQALHPQPGQPAGAVLRRNGEEDKLWQPTFIMEHPTEISPLARANDTRPEVTERFELYITGREFGNGFSELNDAEDQAARFPRPGGAKDSGDDEAMYYDHDFVRALEYGMPPPAAAASASTG
jgi:lysyl-tRNA synthetase class 2